jgi:hypothetical protein
MKATRQPGSSGSFIGGIQAPRAFWSPLAHMPLFECLTRLLRIVGPQVDRISYFTMTESQRYIEYLQRAILSEGQDEVFDGNKLRARQPRDRAQMEKLAERCGMPKDSGVVERFEADVEAFQTGTRFEDVNSLIIFRPILELVEKAAAAHGLPKPRPIYVSNSTDIGPSPYARQSEVQNALLIGAGTATFCNSWAKSVAPLFGALLRKTPRFDRRSVDDLIAIGKVDGEDIATAVRLAAYYGSNGTVIGFRSIPVPREDFHVHAKLLRAMEIFIVAHEYGHFIAQEELASTDGPQNAGGSREIEFFCDALGILLSQTIANEEENYFLASGAGALIFFRLMQLCDDARSVYLNSPAADAEDHSRRRPDAEDSHPSYNERIKAVREIALVGAGAGQRDKLNEQLDFYDSVASAVGELSGKVIRKVFGAKSNGQQTR